MELRYEAWVAEIRRACDAIDAECVAVDERYSGWIQIFVQLKSTDQHRRAAKRVMKEFQRRWGKMGLKWMAKYNAPSQARYEVYIKWANSPTLSPERIKEYRMHAELAQAGSLVFNLGG